MSRTSRVRRTTGKILISAVALFAPVGGVVADWNETHVHNPKWPPHAKFHNGQTLAFAFELAALSLWQLWRPTDAPRSALRWGTVLAGLYWAAQAPAVLAPGAALADPEFAHPERRIAGLPANQLTVQALFVWPLLAIGFFLANDRANEA